MSEVLTAGQTRIDQYEALEWAWVMLRRTPKEKAKDRIQEMLSKLSHGETVDFLARIEKLKEASG